MLALHISFANEKEIPFLSSVGLPVKQSSRAIATQFSFLLILLISNASALCYI